MNRCREQGAEVLRQLEADEQLLTECSRLLSKEQGKCQPFWLDNQKTGLQSRKAAAWRWSVVPELFQAHTAYHPTHRCPSWSWTNSLTAPPFWGSWCPLQVFRWHRIQWISSTSNTTPGQRLSSSSLNHAVSQYSHPPPKASNESISLLPGEEDKARNRQDSFSVSATINAGCRRMERTLASCTMVFITHLNKCTLINTMQCRGRTFLTVFKERPSTQKKQVLWGLLQMFPPSVTALARINSAK